MIPDIGPLKNVQMPFKIENNVLKGETLPFDSKYVSIGQLLYDRMKSNPNVIGQIDAMTEIQDDFAGMLDRAVKCALWMKKEGVRRGDIIAVCTHNHLDSYVPCVAALFLGAIFTPWNPDMNTQAARHFISLAQPKIVFTNEDSAVVTLEAAKIEVSDLKVVVFGEYLGALPFSKVLAGHDQSDVDKFQCTEITDANQTALILYSSGTTGAPKGIQLSHFSFLHHLDMKDILDMRSHVSLWFSSLYWISGSLLTLQSIASGTRRIVAPAFEEEIACKIIEKYKVTWLLVSTSMTNRFVRSAFVTRYDLSSLKMVFTGGALLKRESQDDLKKLLPNALVLQAYGMTELGGLVANQLPTTMSGSCGIVSRNCQIKIIDPETGKTLGPNEIGEICAKSETIMTGYYNNPEATKNTIDTEGWLHTGDLGYYNDKGELFITERLKELIKYRGYHVTPGEIENLIQSHPAVLEVCVVPVPHCTDDEHPMAFVSRIPGMKVTEQELIDLVARNLMDINRLRGGVQFLNSLPHTASGKIARKELKALAKGRAVD